MLFELGLSWTRLREKMIMKIAFSLPRSVAYWCAIRVGGYATCGKYGCDSPTDLKFMDALKRWEMSDSATLQ